MTTQKALPLRSASLHLLISSISSTPRRCSSDHRTRLLSTTSGHRSDHRLFSTTFGYSSNHQLFWTTSGHSIDRRLFITTCGHSINYQLFRITRGHTTGCRLFSSILGYSSDRRLFSTTCGHSSDHRLFQTTTGPHRLLSTTAGHHTDHEMANLFTDQAHAELYTKYRPVYPPSVLQAVVEFCKRSPGGDFNYALDVGCGSGQSTRGLLQYYDRVQGVDVSEAQIAKAPRDEPRLAFRVGGAEDLSFEESGVVDLLTVAQAIHWVDLDKFYPEVERVLKPRGVLAIYGYGNVSLDRPAASTLVSEFYQDLHRRGYWNKQRKHIDTHYRDIAAPAFADFQREDSLVMKKTMPLSAFVGYVNSWSAYNDMKKDQPESKALDTLHRNLLEAYGGGGSSEPMVEATWPIFILMAKKA